MIPVCCVGAVQPGRAGQLLPLLHAGEPGGAPRHPRPEAGLRQGRRHLQLLPQRLPPQPGLRAGQDLRREAGHAVPAV